MNIVLYMYIIHIYIYIYKRDYIHTHCIIQYVSHSMYTPSFSIWAPDQAGGFGVGECLSGNVADGGGRGAKWLIGWSWATKEHCGLIMV